MIKKKYIPQPIDTTDVKLPEDLELLVEQMSKSIRTLKLIMKLGFKISK